jgi:DNA-binding GntR family transcriptional regulator
METQSLLTRDGRSLIVASLDHNQLAELYVVRGELEGWRRARRQHATPEEVRVLRDMLEADRALVDDPRRCPARTGASTADPPRLAQPLPRAAARPRAPEHGAPGLDLALGRGPVAGTLEEHEAIVRAIEAGRRGGRRRRPARAHQPRLQTRLRLDAAKVQAAE